MQKSNKEGFFGSGEEITAAFDKIEKSNVGIKVGGGRRIAGNRPVTSVAVEVCPPSNSATKPNISSKSLSVEIFPAYQSPCSSTGTTTCATPRLSAVVSPRPPLPRGISCTAITHTPKGNNQKTPLPDDRLQNTNNNQQGERIATPNGRIWRYATPAANSIRTSLHPDITLTPLKPSTPAGLKTVVKTPSEATKSTQQKRPSMEAFYVCSHCKHNNRDSVMCEACKMPLSTDGNMFNMKESNAQLSNKPVLTKKIFYGEKLVQQSSSSDTVLQNSHTPPQLTPPHKVFVASETSVPKGRARVSKSKVVMEPECLTISSDEEDSNRSTPPSTSAVVTPNPVVTTPIAPPVSVTPAPATPVAPPRAVPATHNMTPVPRVVAAIPPIVRDVNQATVKVPQSSSSETVNATTSTTNTHLVGPVSCITRPSLSHVCHPPISSLRLVPYGEEEGEEEEEEEEEMEMEEEEEEEDEEERHEIENYEEPDDLDEHEDHEEYDGPEEEEEEDEDAECDGLDSEGSLGIPIWCRSIRIGSFKVHSTDSAFLPVYVNGSGFMFDVHTVTNVNEKVKIRLRPTDIVHTLGHFGRCLPILFIYTNQTCGALIRNKLHMRKTEGPYFDPSEKDERQTRITFLIEIISDEHRVFLRHIFPGEGLLQEIDQKIANEILVRSTPTNQQQSPAKCHAEASPPGVLTTICQQPLTQSASLTPSQFFPQAPIGPVVKVLTYPPPPHPGRIVITSEDVQCLDEGEFLNDVIIDFYLKYLMNEVLSETDRQRTHVFSSYFYPRLTQKPGRPSASAAAAACTDDDDHLPSVSARRHGQVKTWTRHVDIFEKDFIIIPINQSAHWFLAILCFPGLVSEHSRLPPKSASAPPQKSVDKVTSTNDAEPATHPQCHAPPLPPPHLEKEPVYNSEGFNGNVSLDTTVTNYPQSPMIPYEHEEVEPGVPEDLLPDSSTHPDIQSRKKKPCIIVFDSLAGPSRWKIVGILREYLDIEWKMKKSTKKTFDCSTMQGFVPKVPQQSNFSDCGLFVLHYVEAFFEKPLPYFGCPLPRLIEWFPPEEVSTKREAVKNLISELQKRQQSSGLHSPPAPSPNPKPEKIPAVIVPVQAASSQNAQNR